MSIVEDFLLIFKIGKIIIVKKIFPEEKSVDLWKSMNKKKIGKKR